MDTEKKNTATLRILNDLDVHIRARYPILYLLTHEEARIESLLHRMATKRSKQLFSWSGTKGLVQVLGDDGIIPNSAPQLVDPAEVLRYIEERTDPGIFVLKDFHPFLDDPLICRRLREAANDLKNSLKTIIIVAPRLNLPAELEKDITLIDVPLPDFDELMKVFMTLCETIKNRKNASIKLTQADAVQMVRAAQGMTLAEAENAFAKAIVTDGLLDASDVSLVLEEKQQLIRKSGVLEFYPAKGRMADVGGMEALKEWLRVRGKAYDAKAAAFGLAAPKGVLLLGAPGCGKSLMAKAVASAWKLPLVRLDLGRIFSGLVGSSEENMRNALKVADGIAPTVLWLDEIEKGLAGNGTGSSDGGTASRVFGTFLTWMQEKKSDVFVVATANRIDLLPPELLRKGRFDELFFVDLPTTSGRMKIFEIHLQMRGRNSALFDVKTLAAATEGFSGAEIESCVVEGLFRAFDQSRDLNQDDILLAAKQMIPLSVTYEAELTKTRQWAATRARNAEQSTVQRIATAKTTNEKKAV